MPKGFTIERTPINPSSSADQRNQPTSSFKKMAAKNVIRRGEIKNIAVTSAKGSTAIPEKKHMLAATTLEPLMRWSSGFFVLKLEYPPSKGMIIAKQIVRATIDRKNVSS